jgi:hypothetical protein
VAQAPGEERHPAALLAHTDDHDISGLRHAALSTGDCRLLGAYDPTGEKARAVKLRYVAVCRSCGAYTQPRNGKGDAYAYCKACHPGAIERRWSRARVTEATRSWEAQYDRLPSSYDWSRTYAGRRGGEALKRLADGEWPASSVVTRLFGTWAVARIGASRPNVESRSSRRSARHSPEGSAPDRGRRAGDRVVYRTALLPAQPLQSSGGALIPGTDQLRPAAAVDE